MNKQPIKRETVYGVRFNSTTISGNTTHQTKWYNSAIDIPAKYYNKKGAILLTRSFDVYERPSLVDMKRCAENGNRFWLNKNEQVVEEKIKN